MPIVSLFSETYKTSGKGNGSQCLVNWYFEQYKAGATKSPTAIIPTPGWEMAVSISNLPLNSCRGLFVSSSGTAPEFKPRLYGVWGRAVYRFNLEVTHAYVIGYVGDTGETVGMADNGFYFVVVDGISMYKAPLGDEDGNPNYSQITLPVAPKTELPVQPTHVAFLGQRLVINSRNSNYFFYSDFTDPTTLTGGEVFQAGSFYSAEQSSDPLTALIVVNGSLWCFGYRSYEIWRFTSNQDSPFAYVGGSSNAIGCEARYSVATVDNLVFWLASSDVGAAMVYMGQGSSVKNITEAIYDDLKLLQNRETAIGYCMAQGANILYFLSFVNENRTFVYNVGTDKWHEQLLRNIPEGEYETYPYQYAKVYNGETYAGLIAHESCLCRMNEKKYTEWDGRNIVREGVSIPFFDNMSLINIKKIMLDVEVGVTPLLQGYGSSPEIMLTISFDGGYTWSNTVARSIGKQGQYRTLVSWDGCGTARFPVFKINFSEPVPCTIYQARLDAEPWGLE